MSDVTASVTRTDIELLVRLLGATPDDKDPHVSLFATMVDGVHEEPVTIHRAFCHAFDLQDVDGEDFVPERHPDLFSTDWDTDEVREIDPHDPEADRATAQRIVAYLTARFQL